MHSSEQFFYLNLEIGKVLNKNNQCLPIYNFFVANIFHEVYYLPAMRGTSKTPCYG